MGTLFNLAVCHFKYTFPLVIGVYALELIMKSLISAICGGLNIPDFWCKIRIVGDKEKNPDRPYNSFTDYEYHHMTKEENDALMKRKLNSNFSGRDSSDIESRLRNFK